jgi:cell division septum initiation protein DivIVA
VVDEELLGNDAEMKVPAELRDVSFPVSVRGFDRRAVLAYVERVNRVIAELEMSRSSEAVVKRVLDRVGDKTSGILRRAVTSAEEITAGARADAEETTSRARADADELMAGARSEAEDLVLNAQAEAEEIRERSRAEAAEHVRQAREEAAVLREQADAWMRRLQADTEAIAETRRKLLSDLRELAARFEEVAGWADARFPLEEPAGAAEPGQPRYA